MQKTAVIDVLQNMRKRNEKYSLTGRDNGIIQRKKCKIEKIEESGYERIVLKIDPQIIFISSSFFLGLLGDSIRKCKTKEKFKEKYLFDCNEKLNNFIEDGINDALKNISPLE